MPTPCDANAGGGGGSGAAGAHGVTNCNVSGNGGNGGNGTASSITGSSVTYAGGGGGATDNGIGATYTAGTGGAGGGGNGGSGKAGTQATSGSANTGGGGGGAGVQPTSNGGSGGSGFGVIRYLTADAAAYTVTGGTKTTDGSYTVHTFTASGNLVVTLNAPVAAFSGTPLSGTAPLSVTFTDASTNTPTSWSWDFGDTGTSTQQNPTHNYTAAGTYTVALTATNAGGSDVETKTGYITVASAVDTHDGGGGKRGSYRRTAGPQVREHKERKPRDWIRKALVEAWERIEAAPQTVRQEAVEVVRKAAPQAVQIVERKEIAVPVIDLRKVEAEAIQDVVLKLHALIAEAERIERDEEDAILLLS